MNDRPLRAYLVEARYECVRMLRAPGFAIPFLAMPVFFYTLFGVVIFGAAARGEPAIATFFFTAFSVMGVMGPGLFGFGMILAMDREQGALRLKRALPMPAAAHIVAKGLMAALFSTLVMVTMVVAALTLGHLDLGAGQALLAAVLCILGSIPFSAIGLYIGARVSARAAPAVVNLLYQLMLHLAGLFYPLPAVLQTLAPLWPSYHLHQLALGAVGAKHHGQALVHVAVLVAVTVVFGGLAIRRLARPE